MGFSVTSGIVSVDSENISMLASDGVTEVDRRVMRIDTSVNHGNSGGGLFNVCGEVIGIVSAKIVLDDVENIGYAIPSNLAKNVADNIIDHCWEKNCKTMQRALFGVSVIATDTRAVYDSENGRALLSETLTVYSVVECGASDGKVFAGDVIRAVTCGENTIYPTRVHQLIDFLLTARLGDNVTFTLYDGMGDREVTITVTAEMISAQ
jgi:serine protease Do